jgi:hypothetical protein
MIMLKKQGSIYHANSKLFFQLECGCRLSCRLACAFRCLFAHVLSIIIFIFDHIDVITMNYPSDMSLCTCVL